MKPLDTPKTPSQYPTLTEGQFVMSCRYQIIQYELMMSLKTVSDEFDFTSRICPLNEMIIHGDISIAGNKETANQIERWRQQIEDLLGDDDLDLIWKKE